MVSIFYNLCENHLNPHVLCSIMITKDISHRTGLVTFIAKLECPTCCSCATATGTMVLWLFLLPPPLEKSLLEPTELLLLCALIVHGDRDQE